MRRGLLMPLPPVTRNLVLLRVWLCGENAHAVPLAVGTANVAAAEAAIETRDVCLHVTIARACGLAVMMSLVPAAVAA